MSALDKHPFPLTADVLYGRPLTGFDNQERNLIFAKTYQLIFHACSMKQALYSSEINTVPAYRQHENDFYTSFLFGFW